MLSHFMNTELSAFYFDIRKDALYCEAPSSLKRKAALTVVDHICEALIKWLAPVLSFTCDEAWQQFRPKGGPSVHLEAFPKIPKEWSDENLAAKWDRVKEVRSAVTGALEIARAEKKIGSSLEAAPEVYVIDADLMSGLDGVDMAEVCITSAIDVSDKSIPRTRSGSMPTTASASLWGSQRGRSARARGASLRMSARTRPIQSCRPAMRRRCARSTARPAHDGRW